MNVTRIIGLILIVAGIAALGTGGFSFTKETHQLKLGPVELSVKEKQKVNFPIWAGVAAIVVGGRTIRPMDVDIRWVGATLSKNGIIEESGVSAAIMGHPAAGIAWLVNKLHAVDAKLKRGQIVLAGSFTRPVDIAAGDVIHADYGPLGAIGVSFV